VDVITPNDLNRMKAVAARLWSDGRRRWTPGEIAWSLLSERDANQVEFIGDGFCWLQPDYAVIVATNDDDASAALDLVDDRPVQVPDADDVLTRVTRARGYAVLADAPFELDVRLGVEGAPLPEVPDGYRVRATRSGDDLVAAHRDAWRPADLPFADGHRPAFADDATSSFDDAALTRLQSDSLYDAGLHVVVESPDGELVGSCIGWHDDGGGTVVIEPLGVSPDHRKHGLAGALCLQVARLAGRSAAQEVVIHPRGDAAYPAARGAYARAGFVEVGRTHLHGN
jgi:ribosomal protein S18 acetylase RimI-like enzyme